MIVVLKATVLLIILRQSLQKALPNEYLSLLHKYNSDHVDGFDLKGLGFADSIVL